MVKSASAISFTKTIKSRLSTVDFNNIPFGRIFSDHQFVINYENGQWQKGSIQPYAPISLMPACSCLHYGQAIFEGMKANRHEATGDILLFRPEQNVKRFNRSAARMAMPPVPEELFLQALKELIALDRNWVPNLEGTALYIRPVMFGTDPYIGVKASQSYTFIIFTCPVGAYYSHPVKVLVADQHVRAFKGGTGAAKAAGNYAATLLPQQMAKKQGYDQVLWMDGEGFKYIHEIGTMNVFFVVDGKLLTPNLDGCILEGITRNSIIQLAKKQGVAVEERPVSIDEIIEAHCNNKLNEAFGVGTAATITHISDIGYQGKNYQLPAVETRKISTSLKQELEGIKRGQLPDDFGWTVAV